MIVRNDQSYFLFRHNYKGLTVGFTTRAGGISTEDGYKSLNLGLHTADSNELVLKNRFIFSEKLCEIPDNIIFMDQTHSDNIIFLKKKKEDNGFFKIDNALKNTDAVITKLKDTVLCAMTADCVPVLIYEKNSNIIAAVHSGWKGCVRNITLKTIFKICEIGKLKDLSGFTVFIGPCICGNCYEVGNEFAENIKKTYTEFMSFLSVKPGGKIYFNLKQSIIIPLINAGVIKNNIFDSGLCTYENPSIFFSHRKNNISGRIAGFVKFGDLK